MPLILGDLLKHLVAKRHNGKTVDDVLQGHPELSSIRTVLNNSSKYDQQYMYITANEAQRGTDSGLDATALSLNKGISRRRLGLPRIQQLPFTHHEENCSLYSKASFDIN